MKKSNWIRKTHLFRADEYVCAHCGTRAKMPARNCPNCGAAMGRTKYDPSWVDEAEGLSAVMDDDW